jgi:hypothetical protein
MAGKWLSKLSCALRLSVLALVPNGDVVAEISERPLSLVAGAVSASTLPDALLQHFRNRGILLRREMRYGGQVTDWILESADVGPRCEAITRFLRFPNGTDVAAMRNHLRMISVRSVLQERARLAMFYPHGRGKTSEKGACQEWGAKSREITDRLLEAFKSYHPAGNDLSPSVPDRNEPPLKR